MTAQALVLLGLLAQTPVTVPAAPKPAGQPAAPPARSMGSVAAPAVLPPGDLSVYGLLGAPEVGAGYRQGFSTLELEGKALLNYLELSGLLELGVKVPMITSGNTVFAPGAALGLKLNAGARYYDPANFAFVALRPRLSMNISVKLSETAHALGLVELPFAVPLTSAGIQLTPTAGAGAEFHIGSGLSLMATGHLGLDVIKEPLGVTQVRPAWGLRLGIGYRVF